MSVSNERPPVDRENVGWVRSLWQLEVLDLLIFGLLAMAAEALSILLLRSMHAGFFFSFSMFIAILSMIRWGATGALVYAAAGIPSALLSGMAVPEAFMYHVVINLCVGIPALLYGKRDRDRIARERLHLVLYVLACHLTLSVGKGLSILLISGETDGIGAFMGSTLLTLTINVVLCALFSGMPDLLCDMRNYVERMNRHDKE